MVFIPPHVRTRPADARGVSWKAWYQPANRQRDLPEGTRTKAMDDFLMSERLAKITHQVAEKIADEARGNASTSSDTGDVASSYGTEAGHIVMVSDPYPNPRQASRVVNTSDHAAADEFGNAKREGKHTLRDAGLKYDSPKRGD